MWKQAIGQPTQLILKSRNARIVAGWLLITSSTKSSGPGGIRDFPVLQMYYRSTRFFHVCGSANSLAILPDIVAEAGEAVGESHARQSPHQHWLRPALRTDRDLFLPHNSSRACDDR
ncbi:hypothetical protein [Bradyrhizobium arachidis]|uniref:hypothetical protein n=1 Tax=Bradyrhizobium arachidis TaxID=858423 RepID=UPI002161263C|nr:hypothetical protein [Bradyrhizobium arachidis]